MNCIVAKRSFVALVAAGLLATATPAFAGDIANPQAVEKAQGLIDKCQSSIALCAHPTAQFNGLQFLRTERVDDGFKVIYTLNYTAFRGCGMRFRSDLAFVFDDDGYYRSVEVCGRNCTVAPFVATDKALAAACCLIRNDPGLASNNEMFRFIESADARELMKFLFVYTK